MYISIIEGNYYLPSIYNIDSNCRCRLITKARSSRNRMELAFLTKRAYTPRTKPVTEKKQSKLFRILAKQKL